MPDRVLEIDLSMCLPEPGRVISRLNSFAPRRNIKALKSTKILTSSSLPFTVLGDNMEIIEKTITPGGRYDKPRTSPSSCCSSYFRNPLAVGLSSNRYLREDICD
jgi:hypothetical protein